MNVKVELIDIDKENIKNKYRPILASLLEIQNKVTGTPTKKIDKCKYLCLIYVDKVVVSIGAIKRKTPSDFGQSKANVPELRNNFDWELGYFVTKKEYEGHGFASIIAKLLIYRHGSGNLMSSTELRTNPAMVRILEKNGFRLFGKPWKSKKHNSYLGLFLKYQ